MSTVFRILKSENIPDRLWLWLANVHSRNKLNLILTNGAADNCFDMYEVTFSDDTDAVMFKLIFGEAVFSDDEFKLSDQSDDDGPSADKSRLWGKKFNAYNKMEK